MEQMDGQKCQCPHHQVIPFLVLLFGLLFLLSAYDVFTAGFVAVAWPVLVILAGLTKRFGRKCSCCARAH